MYYVLIRCKHLTNFVLLKFYFTRELAQGSPLVTNLKYVFLLIYAADASKIF